MVPCTSGGPCSLVSRLTTVDCTLRDPLWSTIRNVSYWCIFNHVTRLYDLIFIKLLCEPGRKGACPDDWITQQMLRSLDMHVSTGNQIASFPESICF